MTTPLTREEVAKWTNADLARDDRERVLALLDENATLRRERDEDEEHIYWMGQLVCAAAFVMGQVDGQNEHGRAFAACAYCGHEDPRTPEAMTAHATTCAKHPLGAALRERDEARATADIAKAAAEKAGAERDALREALAAQGVADAGVGATGRAPGWCIGRCPVRAHAPECEQARTALARTADAARERDARLVAEARAQALEEAARKACFKCQSPQLFPLDPTQHGRYHVPAEQLSKPIAERDHSACEGAEILRMVHRPLFPEHCGASCCPRCAIDASNGKATP